MIRIVNKRIVSFKKNQKYILHYTGPESLFRMDVMFNKDVNTREDYDWLMLIIVNSRRLYSEEINV
jgi:hypothetical protein